MADFDFYKSRANMAVSILNFVNLHKPFLEMLEKHGDVSTIETAYRDNSNIIITICSQHFRKESKSYQSDTYTQTLEDIEDFLYNLSKHYNFALVEHANDNGTLWLNHEPFKLGLFTVTLKCYTTIGIPPTYKRTQKTYTHTYNEVSCTLR